MVDGLANSVIETDVVPSPAPVGSPENFAGNAFTIKKQILQVEGSRDYDWAADRWWKIVTPAVSITVLVSILAMESM